MLDDALSAQTVFIDYGTFSSGTFQAHRVDGHAWRMAYSLGPCIRVWWVCMDNEAAVTVFLEWEVGRFMCVIQAYKNVTALQRCR